MNRYRRRSGQGFRVPKAKRRDFRSLLGPNLVVVIAGTRPDLHDSAVGAAAVGKVEALTLVLESNALVVGVVPRLGSETGVARPDLHLYTISGGYS